jgi:hypothetical protein
MKYLQMIVKNDEYNRSLYFTSADDKMLTEE